MITQDGSGVDGGKEKPSLKSTPNGLAEARKIISSRVKGIVLIDQEIKYDDRKEEGQYNYAVSQPKLVQITSYTSH